ncbi:MAG: TIGR01212 family radical SAM protein [bacterium]
MPDSPAPNRDGALDWGGCTFCNNEGFSVNSRGDRRDILPLEQQLLEGMNFKRKRYAARKFIAYFQAYTNTYAPLDDLRRLYRIPLQFAEIVGIAIGTRPDCVSKSLYDFLEELNRERSVWLELGLQTRHDVTLERVKRGHDFAAWAKAMRLAEPYSFDLCVHVILGLPGETRAMMLETADTLAEFRYESLKIHLLHVMRHTPLEQEYHEGRFKLLEREEYVNLVVDFLERVSPQVAIQRLTADAPPQQLVAPDWCRDKGGLLQDIDRCLADRNTWQGRLFSAPVRVESLSDSSTVS